MKAPPEVREIVRAVVWEQPATVERQVAESARRFWDLPDVGRWERDRLGSATRQPGRPSVYDARRESNQKRSDGPESSGTGTTASAEVGIGGERPTA
jgi:hypothetical protein